MERKRDKNGRFAKKEQTEKKELTSKEYETKIAELEEKIEFIILGARRNASFWENKYHNESERFEVVKKLGNKRGEAIEWLLSKVPFWTRYKFWDRFGVL